MDIIIIIILGFLLLILVLILRKPQTAFIDRFMEKGRHVQPLLKEKSAGLKYHHLHQALRNDKAALKKLEQLNKSFIDGAITVEAYNQALDEWETECIKH